MTAVAITAAGFDAVHMPRPRSAGSIAVVSVTTGTVGSTGRRYGIGTMLEAGAEADEAR